MSAAATPPIADNRRCRPTRGGWYSSRVIIASRHSDRAAGEVDMRSRVLVKKLGCRAFGWLWLLLAPMAAQSMSQQLETFDIATFVRPLGWNRTESNGILLLQDQKMLQGRGVFCQIYLFPSQ